MSAGVGAGGDVEQVQKLLLLCGELGREALDVVAVGAGEVVAGEAGEMLSAAEVRDAVAVSRS